MNPVDNTNPTLYEPPPLQETQPGSKDEFLQLLVAQMQHQDPLDPQDGSDFVAQLAQFANIELGVETNTRLASIESGQVSASRAAIMGLVGKGITADVSNIQLSGEGEMPDLTLTLDDPASTVEVVVYRDGVEVATIDVGEQASGDSTISWDGTDNDGIPLPPGEYSVEVMAANGEDGVVEGSLSVQSVATSIEFGQDGSTMLGLGGLLIPPGSIQSIDNGN